MATIKNIQINKHWGVRPTDESIYLDRIWLVKKGQEYSLVQFSINELDKGYFWADTFCVPCDWSEEKIEKLVKEFAEKHITEKDIANYRYFLESGEKWGWD